MRILWDVVIFVCILYASVESPLRVVLSYELAVNGLLCSCEFVLFRRSVES
ncbi:hypothetical protein LEP1GSC036_0567 [Leptospira weilii str. 2006001853]|uniref:Uncharacterized protein n=2 Tax=Leptospira weilii TaxID=28184 RepID=A0A828Z282_9LEPT|nr:hypothetical protein LEP1GSC036_0567 [Leptospira weilii str. 2006001853]